MKKAFPSKLFLTRCMLLQALMIPSFVPAQPVNDDCGDAIEIQVGKDEASAIRVDGDTRGATASALPMSVCSGSFYTDDVWFRFSTVDTLPEKGLIVRVYFDPVTLTTDLPYIGMAIYNSCDSLATPIHCFSDNDPEINTQFLSSTCLDLSSEYLIRLWSGGNTPETEGTFRIAVYEDPETKKPVWSETFDGGLEINGWTTYGTCEDPDSNHNAVWNYLPDGLIDKGAYIFQGAGINSETKCNGAVGVDSDYNNTYGHDPPAFGNFPCESPSRHILISPEIDTRIWNRKPVYITWIQAIRNYSSTYYVAYRTKNEGGVWNDWDSIQINMEFPINGDFVPDNVQQHFMPGVVNHDFLQLMFIYNANYYMWAIDDIKLFTSENYYDFKITEDAIAPWFSVPYNQSYPYFGSMTVYNASYETHRNVSFSHLITDQETSDTVYFSQVIADSIEFDQTHTSPFFQPIIDIAQSGNYFEEYKVSEDHPDSNPGDDKTNNTFKIGGNYFAHEEGFTRSVAPSSGLYEIATPLSYGYGNIFYIQHDVEIDHMVWGVNNPADMVGKSVSQYVIEWHDLNQDQRAQPEERKFIAYDEYEFTGDESNNTIISSYLENFDNPGEAIILKAGKQYMAMVEYQATSSEDPQFFLLASDARDYSGVTAASDTAFLKGLIERPIYMTVLQFSQDGNIQNINFEVRDFGTHDPFIHFGDDIVPLIRLGLLAVGTKDESKPENPFSVFPNPASDHIQVVFHERMNNIKLRLMNNLGQVVYFSNRIQFSPGQLESIHVADLASGQYMLQVEAHGGQYSIPVVIVK